MNERLVVLKETRKIFDLNWNDGWLIKGVFIYGTACTILYGYDKELNQEAITDLEGYFQLNKVSLETCYKRWSELDANFAKKAIHFQGIRMLRQDPWENLISFICSSNNNISRISQMVKENRERELVWYLITQRCYLF